MTAEAIAMASAALHNDFYPNPPLLSCYEHDLLSYHPPVIILVTDGLSNDPNHTLEEIEKLKHSVPLKYEDRIMRIAIGIGEANLDELKQFASVGKIEHADGTISEKTPLVIYLQDEEDLLAKTLQSVIQSALLSSILHGRFEERAENEEYLPTIDEYRDDGDDWLDW